MVDALQRIGRDAQAHVAAERVRDEGDVAQVRQEPALGLDIRVAHLVAHLRALGRQFTAPRHRAKSSAIPVSPALRRGGGPKSCPFREPRTYRGGGFDSQGLRAPEMAARASDRQAFRKDFQRLIRPPSASYKGRNRRRNLCFR